MPDLNNKIAGYFSKLSKGQIIFILMLFLCIVKIPTMFWSDIQPWDEGLYATRVNSIHLFGDFLDQSAHSVGGLFSGSHPPLLIWLGYFFTKVYGQNEVALKVIPFIFSLLCFYVIVKIGEKGFSFRSGIAAAMLFSCTTLYSQLAKAFQFDMPALFFILLSFYLFMLYSESKEKKYLLYCGISFGLCLMTKSLIGLIIPLSLLVYYLFYRSKSDITFLDLVKICSIGAIIALPWHLYMLAKHGSDFAGFLFGFHILTRAVTGMDEDIASRPSGVFYYIKYFLTIMPLGILVIPAFIKDVSKLKALKPEKILLWLWFGITIIIISAFKTKVEAYNLLILPQGCLLAAIYLMEEIKTKKERALTGVLILINIFWIFSNSPYFISLQIIEILLYLVAFPALAAVIYFLLDNFRRSKFEEIVLALIVVIFVGTNICYFVKIPVIENAFRLSAINKMVLESKNLNIAYISPDFKNNPQFSFYFEGINIGWNWRYNYKLLETKYGTDNVKDSLEELSKVPYMVIVETDNMNKGTYISSNEFMPGNYKMLRKEHGYELWTAEK